MKKGEAFGIFGKNGSGKTTAVKLLIGLYPTSENGEVTFNGVDINKLDMEYMRGNKISYVMQNPKMTKKSVSGLFEEIDCEITYETVCQSFSFLSNSLRELALKTIKEFWLKPFYSMSEGERQFITIIRALYKNPEILIMDEPSSSLDSLRQQWLLDLISEIKKDRMVIIISHDNNYEKENRDLCFSLAENVKIEPFDKRMFRLKNGSDRSVVIDEEVRELIGNGEPKAFEDLIRNDYMNYFNKLKLLQYLQQHDVIRFI